jgi:dethiobiotin synthetase
MRKSAIFIAGTDTGVGKTLVSGFAARFFQENGSKTVPQKWIQTGQTGSNGDIDRHIEIMGRKRGDFSAFLRNMVPYSFKFSASPHLAAKMESQEIDKNVIIGSFRALTDEFDIVVVEGVGGLMVPVDEKNLVLDICKEINIPVVIVAANRLGAINHTLLTVETLRTRGMKIIGIIFNQTEPSQDKLVLDDNPAIVGELSGVEILASLSYSADTEGLYKQFRKAGKKILEWLKRDAGNE